MLINFRVIKDGYMGRVYRIIVWLVRGENIDIKGYISGLYIVYWNW